MKRFMTSAEGGDAGAVEDDVLAAAEPPVAGPGCIAGSRHCGTNSGDILVEHLEHVLLRLCDRRLVVGGAIGNVEFFRGVRSDAEAGNLGHVSGRGARIGRADAGQACLPENARACGEYRPPRGRIRAGWIR